MAERPNFGLGCYSFAPADALVRLFREMKTYTAKPGEIERHWYVVDADGQTLGRLATRKRYYRHSGYPGGIRSRTLREQLSRRPEEVLRKAVKGMLPRNRLARQQITKLKIYAGPEHPHAPQAPQPLKWEDA